MRIDLITNKITKLLKFAIMTSICPWLNSIENMNLIPEPQKKAKMIRSEKRYILVPTNTTA